MLSVTIYDNHAEIRIVAPPGKQNRPKFWEALNRLKEDIRSYDREYDDIKKCWVVRNLKSYAHLPYLADAIEIRKMHKTLF
jgi:hypothetical protein